MQAWSRLSTRCRLPCCRVVVLTGNDEDANAQVAALIEKLGFAPLNLGSLAVAAPLQQFGGPLVPVNLIKKS
ncbi:hypothetical protein PMI09_00768 [Rhizobium sp. CF122]|uniref:hypothetical protein n=1 Tax=Rhizobium sp. CF122 TaxID=1144312 RepID=UPI000271B12A|nr:hypothetical protein [Rhizobium sp. CF122]EJL57892.1 hypothetical protein PMI09_00768 [Rhizobium sp. CF122]